LLQLLEIDGLGQVVIKPRSKRTLPGRLMPVSGQSDEHNILENCLLAYSCRQLITVEPRQADIQQHDVRPVIERGFQRG
jgi:hypothetical protein